MLFAGQFRLFSFLQRAQAGRFHKSGYVVIAEIALRRGHGKHDGAGHELRAARKFGALIYAVIGTEHIARDRRFGQTFGDQAVDHVDHAANRLTAIGEGRRPAQDLDLVGIDAVRRHLMVRARRRHVNHADPVGQHLHPFGAETAQHRPACALSEEGRGDARLAGQRIAQGRGEVAHDVGPLQRRRIADQFVAGAVRAGRRGDHHRGEPAGRVRVLGMGRAEQGLGGYGSRHQNALHGRILRNVIMYQYKHEGIPARGRIKFQMASGRAAIDAEQRARGEARTRAREI